jgi:serine phosphatase RsbU (regulator of sigma subunit)
MTSLGINSLINAVSERRMIDPAEILRYSDKYITTLLKTSEHEDNVKDGMDIGIVAINLKTNKISFSGAGRPLYCIKEGELIKISGSLKSIGSQLTEFPFENTLLDFSVNDQFYLFSDGMVDQFGGDNDKRLGSKNFTQFLLSNQHLSIEQQLEQLNLFIKQWMRISSQTDDMIWIGFKMKKE